MNILSLIHWILVQFTAIKCTEKPVDPTNDVQALDKLVYHSLFRVIEYDLNRIHQWEDALYDFTKYVKNAFFRPDGTPDIVKVLQVAIACTQTPNVHVTADVSRIVVGTFGSPGETSSLISHELFLKILELSASVSWSECFYDIVIRNHENGYVDGRMLRYVLDQGKSSAECNSALSKAFLNFL